MTPWRSVGRRWRGTRGVVSRIGPQYCYTQFRVQGPGFRVQGSGFRVQGSGLRIQGTCFGVHGSSFRPQTFRIWHWELGEGMTPWRSVGRRCRGMRGVVPIMRASSGCRVQGAGFRVQGAGCRVQGAGFRVQGAEFRVQGSGFTPWRSVGRRWRGMRGVVPIISAARLFLSCGWDFRG